MAKVIFEVEIGHADIKAERIEQVREIAVHLLTGGTGITAIIQPDVPVEAVRHAQDILSDVLKPQNVSYIRDNAMACPKCGGPDIAAERIEANGGQLRAYANVKCHCGHRYTEMFALIGVEE